MVSTFWNGKEEAVQVTVTNEKGYAQMTRDQAIDLFNEVWSLLLAQKLKDKQEPPWWQHLAKEAAK
jgi:hypothetical protein